MNQITHFLYTSFLLIFFISNVSAQSSSSTIKVDYNLTNSSCASALDGTLQITAITGGNAPYEIFLNGQWIGSDVLTLSGLSAGDYLLSVYDSTDDLVELDIEVGFDDDLDFFITDRVKIRKGESYTIDLELDADIDGITWFIAPAIDNRFILQPTVNPEKDQIYRAEIRYNDACVSFAEVLVEVDSKRYVYFPNIFSPNNDGINDTFYPSISDQVVQIRRFIISDRWGRIVHSRKGNFTDPMMVSWDGKYNNKYFEMGQYVYLCEVEFEDGQIIRYKGSVSIL